MQRVDITVGQVTFSAVLDRELVLLRVTDLLAARGSIAAERLPPRSRSRPPGPLRLTGPDPPARSPSRSLHPSPATSDPAAVSVGIAAPNAATERGPSLRLAAARLGPAARCWPPSARGFLNFTSLGSPVPQWTLASICCPALAWSPSAEPAAPAAAARAGAEAQLASLAWACAQPLPAGFSPLR